MPETERTLGALAPQFDLEPDGAPLRFDRSGFSLAGAIGRVEKGKVILHPDRFDPRLPLGRAVLAHELAHLFQQRLPGAQAAEGSPALAELEARNIATRVQEGRGFERPVIPLTPRRVLFDQSLSEQVGERFAGEIHRIKRLLRGWLGFLWVTDGAVREIFTLVETLDFAVAQAIFGALDRGQRATLMDNVSPGHFPRFRKYILAAFSMTERGTIAEHNEELFEGMEFSGLERDEIFAVHHVFNNGFPAEAQARLMADPQQGRYVRQIVEAEGGIAGLAGLPVGQSFEQYRAEREAAALERLDEEAQSRAQATEAARDDPDGANALERLRALLEDPNDAERLQALDLLGTFLDRPEVLTGIVLELQPPMQMEGLIDNLLDDFPERALVEASNAGPAGQSGPQHRRIETLMRVAEQRPPWKNVLLAENLLSSGLFNVLTSSEAFMAFQILKALPPEVRSGYLEENGGAQETALYGAMSQSMREGAGLNFYRGGEGRLDLASIQSQLMDDELWQASQIGRLSGLIRMAGAAGEAEWLFGRSREVAHMRASEYHDRDFRARIVEPFMLYGSRGTEGDLRTEWRADYGDWAVENIWQAIGSGFETIGDVFNLLGDSRSGGQLVGNALFGNSIGGEGISAAAFQDLMGGSFMGIRFVAPEDRIEDADLAREIAEADEADRGVNYIDRAYWDTDRGVLELQARDLAIAAIRYPIGDTLVSNGSGRMRQLDLNLSYAARRSEGRPTNMRLEVGTLELNDLLVVFRDSMLAINKIELRDLQVDLGRDAIAGELPQARTGVAAWKINPITPILRLIGLSGDLAEQSATMVNALTEPAQSTPLLVDVAELTLHGVQTSGGQYFETIGLEHARIGISGSVEDYQQILWQSVRSNISQKVRLMRAMQDLPAGEDRDGLETRIARIAERVSALQALMRDLHRHKETYDQLYPRRDSLSEADSTQLQEATDYLAPYREGGITIDAGRILIQGAEGGIGIGNLDLQDVHGRGGGAPGLMAFLTDSEALNRIAQGPAHNPPLREGDTRGGATISLELGDIEIDNLRIGAGIPKIADAERDVTRAEAALAERDWDPTLRAEVERLRTRLRKTTRYRSLAATGISYLTETETQEMVRLRTELLAEEALYVHHLEAEDARLGFDAGQGAVSLSADRFEATGQEGVEGPQGAAIRVSGTSIGAASGTNIDLSVGVLGGLHGFSNLRERLNRAGIRGDTLRLNDIEHAASGMGADLLEVDGFNFDLQARQWQLDASATRIHAEGIRERVTRGWLETQITGLENRGARRSEAEDARLEHLQEMLATYEGFEDLIRDLNDQIDAAADDATRQQLEAGRRDVYTMFAVWEARMGARSFTLHGLDAVISGNENLAETGFDFGQSLETGITVQGRGDSTLSDRQDRIFESLSATDARFGDGQAGQVEVGETAGRVTYGRQVIELSDLAIESISVSQFHMTTHSDVEADEGGGSAVTQFFSDGTSTLTGIRVTARLDFEPVENTDGEYRLSTVEMSQLDVERIEGEGLGYFRHHHPPREGPRDPDVTYGRTEYRLESGVLNGLRISDLSATLPEDEDGHMRLQSHVRVDSIENAQASAFIEGTLNESRVRFSTGSIDFDVNSEGGVTHFNNVLLPAVTLHSFNFRGGGKSVRAARPVRVSEVRADAAIDRTDPDITAVILNNLHITSISGEDLTVVYPPYTIHIRQDERLVTDAILYGREAPPPLSIANLDITGLRWSSDEGVVPSGTRQAANIDVQSVHAAFNAMTEDETMNLDGIIDASEIDFDFLRDGTERLSIDDVDAQFRGQAAEGITVDTEIRDLSTGEVTIDGRRITIPNLSIPTINLERLDWDSDAMRIQIPEYNARATLTGTTAALELITAAPESEAPFEQLSITSLVVPDITMRGVIITLKDAIENENGSDDLVVTISPQYGASITNLRVTPRLDDPAFTITPDPSGAGEPVIMGRVHFDQFDTLEMQAEVENLISAEANVRVSNLDYDFLGSGGETLSIQELRLRDLTGNYGNHRFNMTAGQRNSSTQVAQPEATINGLQRAADGTVTIDSADLSGLVYERRDLGVRVDIRSAELPASDERHALTYGADGTAIIPEAVIRDAHFHVNDLSNMGDDPPGAQKSPPLLEHMDFLDALSGTFDATLGLPWLPDDRVSFQVQNGFFDFDQIENELWTDLAVDFDFDDDTDRLVLNIDWGNAVGLLSPIVSLIPQANYEAIAFQLEDADEIAEARRRAVRLSTFATRVESEGGGDSSDPPISIYDIDANFNLGPTRVDLKNIGGLLISGDGNPFTSDLSVTGGLYPSDQPQTSSLDLTLNELNAEVDPGRPLTFSSEDGSSTTVESGQVQIRRIRNTRLNFHGFSTPGSLDGNIEEARITNLRVTRAEAEEDSDE